MKTFWSHFWVGWATGAIVYCIFILSLIWSATKCKSCKKHYLFFRSTSKYKSILCSQKCEYEDRFQSLLSVGCPVEYITEVLAREYPKMTTPTGGRA